MVSRGWREKRTRPAESPPERKWTKAFLRGVEEEAGLDGGTGGASVAVLGEVEGCLTPTAGAKALRRRGCGWRMIFGTGLVWESGCSYECDVAVIICYQFGVR